MLSRGVQLNARMRVNLGREEAPIWHNARCKQEVPLMDNVAHLATTIQHLLGPTADRLAKETGCIKRERAFTGSSLVQALVFGWMNEPMSTLSELAGAAATVGAGVSRQAIHKRLTRETARFLYAMLCEVAAQVVVSDPVAIPLLKRFTGVYIEVDFDSCPVNGVHSIPPAQSDR